MRARFIAAAHPDHALHRLGRPLSLRDLRAHRHLVVRDTGSMRSKAEVTLDAAQRWTVSHVTTSIEAARMGMGFAWFPEERIRPELEQGLLEPLPLGEGIERFAELYLVVPDAEFAGPGTRRLAAILRESVARACSGEPGMPDPAPAQATADGASDRRTARARAGRARAQASVMSRSSKKKRARPRRS
jgi:DNA-binding transcriptional LysR family regulator